MGHKTDPLELLRSARPRALDPNRLVDDDRKERDFAAIVRADPPAATSVPRRRRAVRWAVPAVAGGVAVVLAVTISTSQGTRPRQAAPVPPADVVLLRAAAQAESGAGQSSGKYWVRQVVAHGGYVVGEPDNRYTMLTKWTWEEWFASQTGEASYYLPGGRWDVAPRTPDDAAAWRRAGSPERAVSRHLFRGMYGSAYPNLDDEGASLPEATVSLVRLDREPLVDKRTASKLFVVAERMVSLNDLRALPGEPEALRAELLDGCCGPEDEPEWSWMSHELTRILTMPVPDDVRAAAYRLLADAPQVRTVGPATDQLGRTGVAIEIGTSRGGVGPDIDGARSQQVIVTEDGRLLAMRDVLRAPNVSAPLEDGMVLTEQTIERAEWTDEEPDPPVGSR